MTGHDRCFTAWPGIGASGRVCLERREAPAGNAPVPPTGVEFRRLWPLAADDYLALFDAIGAGWMRAARGLRSRDELAQALTDPGIEVYALNADGGAAGLLELDRRVPGDVEIVHLGVRPVYVGRRFGAFLLAAAVHRAFDGGARRVWMCPVAKDRRRALDFFLRAGFHPAARGAADAGPEEPEILGALAAAG